MGYVYLLTDGEYYKIGVTRGSIEGRIKKLQTGNANEISMVAHHRTSHPFRMEKMLHARHSMSRVSNEWFMLSHDEVNGFLDECLYLEGIINSLKYNPFFSAVSEEEAPQ